MPEIQPHLVTPQPEPVAEAVFGTILRGRVAVVTGAARGIGRAAAVALAAAGADVVGIDLCAEVDPKSGVAPATRADLHETGRQVAAAGRRWLALELDQRDRAAVRAAAAQAEQFGPVGILFANASIQSFVPLLEMTDSDWDTTIDTNLTGNANVLRAFVPAMRDRGYGRVIITSSTQGQRGTLHAANYAASKWGLIGLMKSAALEWGAYGITVNCLIPGLIDTALTRHEERYAQAIEVAGKQPTGDEAKDEKTAREGKEKKTPLGVAFIDPNDLAPMVVFLASDAARMCSGGTFPVTGGDSANLTP